MSKIKLLSLILPGLFISGCVDTYNVHPGYGYAYVSRPVYYHPPAPRYYYPPRYHHPRMRMPERGGVHPGYGRGFSGGSHGGNQYSGSINGNSGNSGGGNQYSGSVGHMPTAPSNGGNSGGGNQYN